MKLKLLLSNYPFRLFHSELSLSHQLKRNYINRPRFVLVSTSIVDESQIFSGWDHWIADLSFFKIYKKGKKVRRQRIRRRPDGGNKVVIKRDIRQASFRVEKISSYFILNCTFDKKIRTVLHFKFPCLPNSAITNNGVFIRA